VPALFVSKDVRAFLRDPAQWAQVAIFFGIMGIYVVNIRNLRYDFSRGFWLHLVSTLNLVATSLTLATLSTRFVFPAVSLEGRAFWVLGLAPVRRREILHGKLAFALLGSLVVAEGLVGVSNWMLRMPGEVFVAHAVAVAFICVGLTGLALGLGALYPNYRETSPSRIVSGFGGTLTLLLSVAFVLAMVALTADLTYRRLVTAAVGPIAFRSRGLLAGAAGLALTALACGLPMACGARALDEAEF
jgi:ABC-2 type transport system permease protein